MNNMPLIYNQMRRSRWFYILLFVTVATNIAVFLNIPVLRQVLGSIFLTVVPGLLIIFLLKLNRLGTTEKMVLTVALSLAFDMIFGWLVNQISLWLGYNAPLSTVVLMPSFTILVLVLLMAVYLHNQEAFSSFPVSFSLSTKTKVMLIPFAILPLLSIVGVYLLTTSGSNLMLLGLLFLVPLSVILWAFCQKEVSSDAYPLALMLLSAALMFMVWLRSPHITGSDAHIEYYMYRMTVLNQHWYRLGDPLLASILGISLLPAIFQSVVQINATEYLFKVIFSLACIIAPLGVYATCRLFLGDFNSFLAALLLISQKGFLAGPSSARTNLALMLFTVLVLVIFHREVFGMAKEVLLIILAVAVMVSHYTTAYIAFLLLGVAGLLGTALSRYIPKKMLNLGWLGVLAVLIFIWYGQITGYPFRSGISFISETVASLRSLAVEEAKSPEAALVTGTGLEEKQLTGQVYFVNTWLTFIFIAIGVLGALWKRKEMLSLRGADDKPSGILHARLHVEFFLAGLAASAILVLSVGLPYVSSYSILRSYTMTIVTLSPFFVLGGAMLARAFRINANLIILPVLLSYFLFTTGAIYTATGMHGSYGNMYLEAGAPQYYIEYIFEEESAAARWLGEHRVDYTRIQVTDAFGMRKLASQGYILPQIISYGNLRDLQDLAGYIYLTSNDLSMVKSIEEDSKSKKSNTLAFYANRNRVYTSNGSEIYQ